MSYVVNLISTADTQKTPDKEPALQKALSPGNCSETFIFLTLNSCIIVFNKRVQCDEAVKNQERLNPVKIV